MDRLSALTKKWKRLFGVLAKTPVLVLLFLGMSSCSDSETALVPADNFVSNFHTNTRSLTIQVGYEEGASPFVKYNTFDAWDVCKQNITDLLDTRGINLKVPVGIEEMTNLGALEQNNYTRENLESFAQRIQKFNNSTANKGIVILFLDGYYITDGTPDQSLLGINLNGTEVIAVFKPVVMSASKSNSEQALIEQSTIVHEIGHALGLVNNGVPVTSAHHDSDHGAHCTNTDCVMYWQNRGAKIQQFIQPFLLTGKVQLFGNQCKSEIKAK